MYLQELHIGYSAFPSCLLPMPGVAVLLLFSSPHISSLTNTARLLPSLLTLPHFRFFLLLTQVQPHSLASVLAYFFIFSFILFMDLYIHASSFLLLLSLMHFLCHSVLQASYVERPAFPQIPSSLPVFTLIVSLSHCPRKSFFSQARKLFKA